MGRLLLILALLGFTGCATVGSVMKGVGGSMQSVAGPAANPTQQYDWRRDNYSPTVYQSVNCSSNTYGNTVYTNCN